MGCFTGLVRAVTSTSIFARALDGGRQALVYEMSMASDADVAMVLPIPVAAGSPETALRFVSREEYPDLFTDIAFTFPRRDHTRLFFSTVHVLDAPASDRAIRPQSLRLHALYAQGALVGDSDLTTWERSSVDARMWGDIERARRAC